VKNFKSILGYAVVMVAVMSLGCASSQPTADTPPAAAEEALDTAPPENTPPKDDSESAEEPLVNRLKWTTATEVDNFGFDVYRSDTEEGPFERITKQPIPGAGTVDEPQNYVFEDTEIDPAQDYYYYVESIAMDGTREVFSPIIKAKAKKPL
jgi:hypothetical protein